MINWVISNNPKDKDKRNVAIASALYANIHQDWISFHDRHDLRDFEDNKHIQHEACEDGFPAFGNSLLPIAESERSDLLYIWDFCRYLHERSERYDEKWDMFVHDDVYPRQFGSQLCGEHFFCWIIKEHLTKFCAAEGLGPFGFLLMPMAWRKNSAIETRTGYCFYHDSLKSLDEKGIILSKEGAKIILDRVLARLAKFNRDDQFRFRESIFDCNQWHPPTGFYASVPLLREYPPNFFQYQGEYKHLFSKGDIYRD